MERTWGGGGGFPEPERAIQVAPEALRALRGKVCMQRRIPVREMVLGRLVQARCSGDQFGRVYRGKIRQLDLAIVNLDCKIYLCAGINAASQEVSSTCNNRLVCCDETMYKYVGIHAVSQEVFSRTWGVTNKRYH